MNKFPKNFLWGAATAAHQVEGGMKNDWSEWEKKNADRLANEAEANFKSKVPHWDQIKAEATDPKNYISGRAVDHYHLYKEDIQIMKKLGFNTYRFSIEWSRVEPEEGQWDEREITHYREVVVELKKNNIEPFVTLWHRTNPIWVARQGSWENKKTIQDFARFASKMASEFKDVRYWITINEPMMTVAGGYLGGIYPPNKKNIFVANQVFKNMIAAHVKAYKAIKKIIPRSQITVTHAAISFKPYKNQFLNQLITNLIDYLANWRELDQIKDYVDFFGIQYYTLETLNIKLGGGEYGIAEVLRSNLSHSDVGWELHPEGIYEFTKKVWEKYKKPIIITENGIADHKDIFRGQYIKDHLRYLKKAVSEGVDVRGYLHWSLLDNLEWDKGFWPKFGLVAVDRKTMKRTIRPSAWEYAKIIKNNEV